MNLYIVKTVEIRLTEFYKYEPPAGPAKGQLASFTRSFASFHINNNNHSLPPLSFIFLPCIPPSVEVSLFSLHPSPSSMHWPLIWTAHHARNPPKRWTSTL